MNIEEIIARDRISNDKNIIADIKKHILTTRRVAKEVFDPVSEKFTLIYLMVKEHVNPTQKFLGSFSTPKIALVCLPLSSRTFSNKSDAPLTTMGESSQLFPAWK